jgi:hypothetical protein
VDMVHSLATRDTRLSRINISRMGNLRVDTSSRRRIRAGDETTYAEVLTKLSSIQGPLRLEHHGIGR